MSGMQGVRKRSLRPRLPRSRTSGMRVARKNRRHPSLLNIPSPLRSVRPRLQIDVYVLTVFQKTALRQRRRRQQRLRRPERQNRRARPSKYLGKQHHLQRQHLGRRRLLRRLPSKRRNPRQRKRILQTKTTPMRTLRKKNLLMKRA